MERPVHLVARVVGHARVIAIYGQQAETGDERGHPPNESGVRPTLVNANAVGVGIVNLHLIAVDQPSREGAGQVGCQAGAGTGDIADLNANVRFALHVHGCVEGQGDIDALRVPFPIGIARAPKADIIVDLPTFLGTGVVFADVGRAELGGVVVRATCRAIKQEVVVRVRL